MNVAAALSKHLSSTARHYPFLLVYVQEFTHGTFEPGTRFENALPFCSRKDAEEWVRAINKKNAAHVARGDAKPGAKYRWAATQNYRVVEHVVVDVQGSVIASALGPEVLS